jgi:hypothetical protein
VVELLPRFGCHIPIPYSCKQTEESSGQPVPKLSAASQIDPHLDGPQNAFGLAGWEPGAILHLLVEAIARLEPPPPRAIIPWPKLPHFLIRIRWRFTILAEEHNETLPH